MNKSLEKENKSEFVESFENLLIDSTKQGVKLKTEDYKEFGKYCIIDQGQKDIAGYTDLEDGVFEDIPAVIFGDHTRVVKYVDKPFFLGADGVKVLKCKDKDANYKYIYYALKNAQIPNTGYNRHFKWLKEINIRYPDKKRQQEVVKTLDKVCGIIDKRKRQIEYLDELIKSRFVEMFGDPESNPMDWPIIPLASLIVTANNGMARRGNDSEGSIVLRLVELQNGYIDYSTPNRIILSEAEKQRYRLVDKDFLFARVNGNPINVGRCAVFSDIREPVYHNDHIIRVHFDERRLDGCFASVLLNSDYGKSQMKGQIKTSAGQYTISQDGIGKIVSILPPVELQQQFSAFVHQIDKSKSAIKKSIKELETLQAALMQKYFG